MRTADSCPFPMRYPGIYDTGIYSPNLFRLNQNIGPAPVISSRRFGEL